MMGDGQSFGRPFQKGEGGRMKGSRNKLSVAFLNDFLEEWREGGREAMRIMRIERPAEFVKTAAYLMPKEMTLEVGPLQELSDDKLITYIEYTERELERRALSIESREESQTDGRQAPLLQAIPKTKIVS